MSQWLYSAHLLDKHSFSAQSHSKVVDNAWRGAEAYHFLMIVQRQVQRAVCAHVIGC